MGRSKRVSRDVGQRKAAWTWGIPSSKLRLKIWVMGGWKKDRVV